MEVYVVESHIDYQGGAVLSVFSDKELAISYADEFEVSSFESISVTKYLLNDTEGNSEIVFNKR